MPRISPTYLTETFSSKGVFLLEMCHEEKRSQALIVFALVVYAAHIKFLKSVNAEDRLLSSWPVY